MAELFVVTITVVIAATLYVFVLGLSHTGASTPYLLGMGTPQESARAPTYDYGVVPISPQAGVTTGMAGLNLVGDNGWQSIPVGTAPFSTCHVDAGFDNATEPCTAPTAGIWYAVLVDVGPGTVASVWSVQSGTTGQWVGPTVVFSSCQEIVVIWDSSYRIAGSTDSLTTYPLAASSVSGESGSF